MTALATAAGPSLAAVAVRVLAATLRVRVAGAEGLVPLWQAGRPVIYAIWHGRILLAPWAGAWLQRTRGARPVTVLASRSRDGELFSRYAGRFGLRVVRGSSSRGGAAGLRGLLGVLRDGHDVAIAPDGPRGPCGRVRSGLVSLAMLSGAPVVPLAVAGRPARRLPTWDALLVPLPLARCAVVLGEPVLLARTADRERARGELERALDRVTAAADRMVAA